MTNSKQSLRIIELCKYRNNTIKFKACIIILLGFAIKNYLKSLIYDTPELAFENSKVFFALICLALLISLLSLIFDGKNLDKV